MTRIEQVRLHMLHMRRLAFINPWYGDGPVDIQHIFDTEAITEPDRMVRVCLTLDIGLHASGWTSNPELDRALHLALTHPGDLKTPAEACSDKEVRIWTECTFGQWAAWTIKEEPAQVGDELRAPGVTHVRCFLDQMNRPILPKGNLR